MTTPSEVYRVKGECPNCHGTEWIERYVDAMEGPPHKVPPEQYLEHRLRETGTMRGVAFIIGDFISKTRQFVLTCQTCGYTLVRDFYKEAEERKKQEEEKKQHG